MSLAALSAGGFTDSFDMYPIADLALWYTNVIGGGHAYSAGRVSGNALDLPSGAAVSVSNGAGAGNTKYQFWVKRSAATARTVLWVGQNTTQQFRLKWNADGTFTIYDETDTVHTTSTAAATGLDVWYHIEIGWTNSSGLGAVVVWLTAVQIINTGTAVAVLGGGGSNTFTLGGLSPTTADTGPTLTFDSLAKVNMSGPMAQNGPVDVIYLPPTGDATPNQMTPSAGSSHYAVVDDVPTDQSDYLTATATAQEELFTYGALIDDGRRVVQVNVKTLASKSATITFVAEVKLPTTAVTQVFLPTPTLAVQGMQSVWEGSETITNLNGFKFGLKSG